MTAVPPSPQTASPLPALMFRRLRGLRSKRARFAAAVLVVLFAVFCTVTSRLFIWPVTGMPARVDAIVVPGGPGNRLDAAIKLAREGRAPYLVLSQGMYIPPELCGAHVGKALAICFKPSPDTTQGEAEGAARLARQYGWHSIVVLTSPDQTWRAELRFRRCYSGHIYGVTTPLPKRMWPYQIVYQWGATAKAFLVNPSC